MTRTGPSRRTLLRGVGLGVGFAASAVAGGGVAAAGTRYVDAALARECAFAAARRPTMPTSTRLLWRADTDEKVLAITFDDGPDPRFTEPLLTTLEAEQVAATFFVCGRQAAAHPDLVRRQAAGGHEVGNHSWSHRDLALADEGEVRDELVRTSDLVAELTGDTPRVLRPPWGRLSGTTMHVAADLGMDVVVWDVRLLDLEEDRATNVAHVREHLAPGMVLLGHDAGHRRRSVGIAAVPEIIRDAKARGYRFVTASQLLALDRTAVRR